ncbi:DotA/TraY family protein [Nitrospirillum sp. BR 11752]|uniref:DotA/TraY family protein n=1 Tax=Nitrospirillum sp. BR 11752 TaxID=3104293 RepID=UPI002E9A6D2E|nr:DotA/TraY family protein [Nitrospirillum sp. BR 11752]
MKKMRIIRVICFVLLSSVAIPSFALASDSASTNNSETTDALSSVVGQMDATAKYLLDSLKSTNTSTDPMVKYLVAIFGPGVASGAVSSHTSTVISNVVSIITKIVFVLAAYRMAYNVIVGIWNTSQEGNVAGKYWNNGWPIFRSVIALPLLAPLPSGFCLVQILIIAATVNGIGLANNITSFSTKLLVEQGVPLFVPASSSVAVGSVTINKLLDIMICRAVMNRAADRNNMSAPNLPQDIARYLEHTKLTTYNAPEQGTNLAKNGIAFGNSNWSGNLMSANKLSPGMADHICGAVIGNTVTPDTSVIDTVGGRAQIEEARQKIAVAVSNAQIQAIYDVLRYAGNPGAASGSDAVPTESELDNGLLGTMATNIVLESVLSNQNEVLGYAGKQEALGKIDYTNYLDVLSNYYSYALQDRVSKAIGGALSNNTVTAALSDEMKGAGWTGIARWATTINRVNSTILTSVEGAKPDIAAPNIKALHFIEHMNSAMEVASKIKSMSASSVAVYNASTNKLTGKKCENTDSECRTRLLSEENIARMISDQWAGNGIIGWATGIDGNSEGKSETGTLMTRLINFGHWGLVAVHSTMVVIVSALTLSGIDVEVFGTGGHLDLTPVTSFVGPLISSFITSMEVLMGGLAYVLPILPVLRYSTQIYDWFRHTVIFFITSPFWMFAHLDPSGDGPTGDAGKQGYFFLVRILFEPAMMVLGFFLGLAVFEMFGSFVTKEIIFAFDIGTAGFTGGLIKLLSFLALEAGAMGVIAWKAFGIGSEITAQMSHLLDFGSHDGGGESEATEAKNSTVATLLKIQNAGSFRAGRPKRPQNKDGEIGPGNLGKE